MPADATRMLMELRETGRTERPITDLPFEIGYTVQREVAAALGETVGGWKVAIGPGGVPIAAPLLASTIHGDGARLDLPATDSIKIETELVNLNVRVIDRSNRPIMSRHMSMTGG